MESDRFLTSPAVRASVSADGLVLLDIDGGVVLASNPIGAHIWQLIEQGCGRVEMARRIAAEYDISLERAQGDVGAFIGELSRRKLVAEDPRC